MHPCKTAAVRSCDQLTFRQKYFSTRGQWTIKLPHTWTKRLSSKLVCVCAWNDAACLVGSRSGQTTTAVGMTSISSATVYRHAGACPDLRLCPSLVASRDASVGVVYIHFGPWSLRSSVTSVLDPKCTSISVFSQFGPRSFRF